ncbi:hypothetical protein IJH02_03370 [Candidatus Saccharibacteria bacterium]|nr:hypothetical protein [Candidatus Saccharibacteria bacterium]
MRRKTNLRLSSIFAAAVIGLGALGAFAPAAHAEDGAEVEEFTNTTPAVWLQISPVSNKVTLIAGENNDYSFTVSNIGSETFGFHVYAAPYSISDEDYNVNFSNETNRTQISRWIKFYDDEGKLVDKASFKIESGAKKVVNYRIEVPKDVPDGGQYATIFAESDETEGDLTGSGIKTVSRVGLIVYGRTEGNTEEVANITDFKIPTFMTSGKISATSKVENGGNTDFEAVYNFEISSIFGKQLFAKTNAYNILPDTTRRVDMEWDETPMMGFYKVHYRVSALNGETAREDTKIVVIMPVWMIIISIILLTFIVLWVIILIRKRSERKSRRLV